MRVYISKYYFGKLGIDKEYCPILQQLPNVYNVCIYKGKIEQNYKIKSMEEWLFN